MIGNFKELNYTNVKNVVNTGAPILPWGSIEPHGEHLPYLTDSILAEAIANAVSSRTIEKTHRFFPVLPTLSMGSQNPSQLEYPFCIHFNTETQKNVLENIVESLERQGFQQLFIVNGHNGNTLKGIVRDVMSKHDKFQIFISDYLNVVEEIKKIDDKLVCYELDDHAAYTETSLMLHVHPELVHLENLAEDVYVGKPNEGYFWTPRNWLMCSSNTRVGTVGMASGDAGKIMFDYVVNALSDEIIEKTHG